MSKKVIPAIIIVVLVSVAAYVWFFVYNKSHTDMSQAEPDVVISAEDLYVAYNEDERGSTLAYNGKILEVTGRISAIKEIDGIVSIYLATSDVMAEISAELDPGYPFDPNNYSIGDEVTLRGECAGYNLDVVLNRCYIVDLNN